MPLGSKMAPPRPIDLQWETHKNLLRNHKAQSFSILCVTTYKGPLYKSCQPCPWGPYRRRPGVVMGKTKKIFFSETTRPFHLLCVAMYSDRFLKILPTMPPGPKLDPPRGSLSLIHLLWNKTYNTLLRNHKAQSFPFFCVAMYCGHL